MEPKHEDLYPLTPMQRGMLFHTLYAPESGVYVNQLATTFRGAIDVRQFRHAWQEVVDRTPVLRTAFVWRRAEEPRQVVVRRAQLQFTELDWSAMPADEQKAQMVELLEEDARRGFELAKPPLMRLHFIHVSPGVARFIWTKHHLLLDGWSNQLVMARVLRAYVSRAHGLDLPHEDGLPFGEYVRWLGRQDENEAARMWRALLGGFERPNVLAIDRRGHDVAGPGHDGDYTQIEFRLEADVASALSSFAARHRVTQSTLFQGAWALAVAALSGDRDVVFGATVSGRSAPLPGIERSVGLFINTLPIRVTVDASRPVADWLQDLQANAVRLRDYEWSPLSEVRRWADVPAGRALFESIVVYENYPAADEMLQPGGPGAALGIETADVDYAERINYPLTFVVSPRTGKLELAYDRLRFDEDAVQRLADQVTSAMRIMLKAGARVGDAIEAPRAQQELVATWNATAAPRARLVLDAIDEVAARRPDAVAVRDGERQTTYRELLRRSRRLAGSLVAHGVGAEERVGIALRRSTDLVVAMLGTLLAGAAFVIVDPTFPAERIRFVAEDAGLRVLLVDGSSAAPGQLPAVTEVLELAALHRASRATEDFVRGRGDGARLAYLVYTSGSTGRPKAVAVTHAGLANTAARLVEGFRIGEDSNVLQFASVAFDGCIGDVFTTLVSGATLTLAPVEAGSSARVFAETLVGEAVTNVTLPPSFLRVVPPADAPALRVIACVGEACPADVVDGWQPGRTLLNGYGPSETSIAATLMECSSATGNPSIGTPIGNVNTYVLDPQERLRPLDVPGHLHVGGVGVARGYFGRPELTAERFLPDPFSGERGARMYATGDIVRLRRTGRLEFIGRSDDQVKVRGFRVELGEVERAIGEHPHVLEVALVARDVDAGDRRLVAHVVWRDGVDRSAALRESLAKRLPEYMVPSTIISAVALPRNTSGKIDREALRRESPGAPPERRERTGELRSDTERRVAAIWAQVLRIEHVGRDDDFFEAAGGDSLLAVRMVAEVEKQFGRQLRVTTVFANPTVARLAAELDRGEEARPAVASNVLASLDASIKPSAAGPSAADAWSSVLLTGATGFVGAHVVAAILSQTSARVVCLVRARSDEEGWSRLRESLQRQQLWRPELEGRLAVLRGDLSAARLGLNSETFRRMARDSDAIFHVGALVNYLYPYARLAPANVLGTQEVLRLAAAERPTPVHHLSTLGVFPVAHRGRPVREVPAPPDGAEHALSYARSKWAAESLVLQAQERGMAVAIYRPADVGGDSESGASNTNDILVLTLQACVAIGAVPEIAREFDVAPVDYVASAMVHIARTAAGRGGIFHLNNPVPLRLDEVVQVLRARGHVLESLPLDRWMQLLDATARSQNDASLARVIALWGGSSMVHPGTVEPPNWDYRNEAASAALAGSGIRCPAVDRDVLTRYVEHWERNGALARRRPA